MVGEKLLLVYDPRAEPVDTYLQTLDVRGYEVSTIVAHGWWEAFIASQTTWSLHDEPVRSLMDKNEEYFQVILDRLNNRRPYDAILASGEMGMSMRMRHELEAEMGGVPLLLAQPIWNQDLGLLVSGFDFGSKGMKIDDFVGAAFSDPVPALDTMIYNTGFYKQVDGVLVRK